jgi:hypothetical protein
VLALDVVQAAFGDCLVLRYGSVERPRALLVDGGPSGTWEHHLRPVLAGLAERGTVIDAVVLSHIDNDHVTGLLDLFAELARDRQGATVERRVPPLPLPRIRALWHNAFSLAAGGMDIAPRVREALATMAATEALPRVGRIAPPVTGFAPPRPGVAEGDALQWAATSLRIPINDRFADARVLLDDTPSLRLAGPRVDIVGPGEAILAKLREEWLRWLERHGRDVASGRQPPGVAPDRSVPNLSSIVLLVRSRGRSVLLTGDGRGDHVVAGLRDRGLLDGQGRLHVDVLKVPHHGSARNATPAFFRSITATTYAISADGRYGNPDAECLASIVDVARADGRRIELVLTNETEASRQLVAERPPATWGYSVRVLPADEHAITIDLAP